MGNESGYDMGHEYGMYSPQKTWETYYTHMFVHNITTNSSTY